MATSLCASARAGKRIGFRGALAPGRRWADRPLHGANRRSIAHVVLGAVAIPRERRPATSPRTPGAWNPPGRHEVPSGFPSSWGLPMRSMRPCRWTGPRGIPGQVVVGDPTALLEVHAFGERVGCDRDVVGVGRLARRRLRGLGREAERRVGATGFSITDPCPARRRRGLGRGDGPRIGVDPLARAPGDPLDGVGAAEEHERLASVARVPLRDARSHPGRRLPDAPSAHGGSSCAEAVQSVHHVSKNPSPRSWRAAPLRRPVSVASPRS